MGFPSKRRDMKKARPRLSEGALNACTWSHRDHYWYG